MLADRRHLAIEIVVEDVDHGFGRQPVGQRGKAAQIRQPDRGLHGFGMAAADWPAENSLAGAVADIGVEQRRRGAAQADDLAEPRQRPHDRSQRVELLVAEAARLFGGPARGVDRAGEKKRQRDVVGDALGAHVVEERKTPAFGIVQPISDLPPAAVKDRQRTLLNSGDSGKSKSACDDDLGALPPDEAAAENVRVQRADEDADAPERQAGLDQALAGLRHHRGRGGADRAPSISQSVSFWRSAAFMGLHLRASSARQAGTNALRFGDSRAKSAGKRRARKCRIRSGNIGRNRRLRQRAGSGRSRDAAAGAGAAHRRAALAGGGKTLHPRPHELPGVHAGAASGRDPRPAGRGAAEMAPAGAVAPTRRRRRAAPRDDGGRDRRSRCRTTISR